jgi:hypothetical protein
MRKGTVDIKDVSILTNGKVKSKDLFGGKNPENVFEIIETKLGAGKSRKLFKEFFDYTEDQYQEIMQLYKKPHDWLLLNLKHKRLFKELGQEIVFEE